jgi:hypothetical protein
MVRLCAPLPAAACPLASHDRPPDETIGIWLTKFDSCLVELRGFEPLTPCMPLMLGWFTMPCRTSRAHTTALVSGAVEGRVVRRREVACSAVSGKSLARAPCVIVLGTNAGAIVSAALDRLRLATSGALLSSDDYGSRVERDGGAIRLCGAVRCLVGAQWWARWRG